MSRQHMLDKNRGLTFGDTVPVVKVDKKTLQWIHNSEYQELIATLPEELRYIGFKLRAMGSRQAQEMNLSEKH